MPFGSGPYGVIGMGVPAPDVASPNVSELSSSRELNAEGRYELNDEGGFKAMDDVTQRVLILVSRATNPRPPIISGPELERMKERIRSGLSPLLSVADPDIKLRSIDVRSDRGRVFIDVNYRDLRTNTVQTAKASL